MRTNIMLDDKLVEKGLPLFQRFQAKVTNKVI